MTEGYKQQEYKGPVKRYCQTMDLKDNPELIERYRKAHSKEEFWPIIGEGIKQCGILEMEIYILDNRLFMIVDAPADFNWDEAMAKLSTLPRQQEWEDFVAVLQGCQAGQTSDEKWKMMERMFHIY